MFRNIGLLTYMPKKRGTKRKVKRRAGTQRGGSFLGDAWNSIRSSGVISGALGMLPIPGASLIARAAGKMGGFGAPGVHTAPRPRVRASGMKV